MSLLKPLHGEEPGLYENLRSFVERDYPSLQLVLGANDAKDGALPVADKLIRDMPVEAIEDPEPLLIICRVPRERPRT